MFLRNWARVATIVGLVVLCAGARADLKFAPSVVHLVNRADYATAVDLDKDGNLDILCADQGSGVNVVYGKGDGTFEAPVFYPIANGVYQTVAADFNGDGKLDIVACAINSSAVGVMLATGPRSFAPRVLIPVGDTPYGVEAADVNEDGWPDLIVSNSGSGSISILINKADGTGTFKAPVNLPFASVNQAVVADFNRDGHMDIAASSYDGYMRVYLGDGKGGFDGGTTYTTANGCIGVLAGDFNNDGWLDIATDDYWSNKSTIFLNDKTGHFIPQVPVDANQYPHICRAADIDMDGKLDLIMPNAGTSNFSVQLNYGGGNMAQPVSFTGQGRDSRAVAVGDFNGDGKPDVIISDPWKEFGSAVGGLIIFLNTSDPGPPAVSSVTVASMLVTGGTSTTGTVRLNWAAPPGGIVVNLSSSSSAVTVPASVTVPEGSITATFPITTAAVAAKTAVDITGSYNGTQALGPFTVLPPAILDLAITPSSVWGGTGTYGKLTLSGPAPTGGLTISLSSNNPCAIVFSSTKIAEGSTTTTFPIATVGVPSLTASLISATFGSSYRTATVRVYPSMPAGIKYNPSQVRGGTPVVATMTLTGPAPPAGLTVNLSSLNPSVLTPDVTSVTIPAGQTSTTFNVTTYAVTSLTTGVIKATTVAGNIQIGLRVYPAAPATITFSGNPVYGGWLVTGTLHLTSPAPVGGLLVGLKSQDTLLVTVPDSVTVPAGQTAVDFPVQSYGVATQKLGVIVATANGESIYFGLSLYPAVPLGIKYNYNPVKGGKNLAGTLTLNGLAPAGGLTVTLTAETPGVATAPATVVVPHGQGSVSFLITTKAVTQNTLAVFAASANGTTIHIGFMVVP